MGYGKAQKSAFSNMIIGSLLCIAGTAFPYWLKGAIDINTVAEIFSIKIPFLGNNNFIGYYSGIWWHCTKYFEGTKCHSKWGAGHDDAKNWVMRMASLLCCSLSLLCALTGLWRNCCGVGAKTLNLGVDGFFGAVAGFTTIGIFASITNADSSPLGLVNLEYAWAFFIFIVGTVIICISSIVLCMAEPENQEVQVISTTAPTSTANAIFIASSTQEQSFVDIQQPIPRLVNIREQQELILRC